MTQRPLSALCVTVAAAMLLTTAPAQAHSKTLGLLFKRAIFAGWRLTHRTPAQVPAEVMLTRARAHLGLLYNRILDVQQEQGKPILPSQRELEITRVTPLKNRFEVLTGYRLEVVFDALGGFAISSSIDVDRQGNPTVPLYVPVLKSGHRYGIFGGSGYTGFGDGDIREAIRRDKMANNPLDPLAHRLLELP
ncbi:MAG: hypothetical protein H6707_11525 [Deltaproteobacteria bacterium]|nr:hypothetical protein [Deltaproteobacteria bacterium]